MANKHPEHAHLDAVVRLERIDAVTGMKDRILDGLDKLPRRPDYPLEQVFRDVALIVVWAAKESV